MQVSRNIPQSEHDGASVAPVVDAARVRFDVFPIAVIAVLVAKVLFARWMALDHVFGTGVTGDIVFVVALGALAASLPKRASRWTLAALDVLISLMLISTVFYSRYFDQIPSLLVLNSINQVADIGDSIAELIAKRDIVYVLDLPFVIWFAIMTPKTATPRRVRRSFAAVGAVALAAFVVSAVLASFLPEPVDSRATSFTRGVFVYQFAAIVPRSPSPEELVVREGQDSLQRRIDVLARRQDQGRVAGAPVPGSLAGKNVIIIQSEALQQALMGARIDGQPVVPNLEQFAAKSWQFNNAFSQIGKGNTADAEFTANTSLYPALNEATPMVYGARELPSLPRLLNAQGYDTFTMHTNDARFWNRVQLYPAIGFKRYYDVDFFGRTDVTGHGASDGVLFEKALPELQKAAEKGPFYAQLVTISAHNPFRAVAQRGTVKLPKDEAETLTGRYVLAESYADAELGRFLEKLDETGLLDSSVVVIYGDHFGMLLESSGPAEDRLRDKILGHEYNRADFYNVPLLVHVPGQTKGQVVEQAVGQIDVMPTVADLLGLDLSSTTHFGRSVFERTPTVLTKGGAIDLYIDDERIYMAGLTDSEDLAFATGTHLPLPAQPPTGSVNPRQLLALSEAYVGSLPQRRGRLEQGGFNPKKDRSATNPKPADNK